MGMHFIPPHRRASIEAEIELHLARVERLLARLDRADGDCDIEDDDPAGGAPDDVGELDEDRDAHDRRIRMEPPLYGIDQSRGPINVLAANNRFSQRICA